MPELMLDLAIQIVNYKSKDSLTVCLLGLEKDLKSVDFSWEILILDNNSGDDLSSLKKKYPHIRTYYSDKNIGFGAGHNWLSKKNESKYILLLNPDIEFMERQTIKRMLTRISSSKEVAIVGPKLLKFDGKPQPYDHINSEKIDDILFEYTGWEWWRNNNSLSEVRWVSGAAFLIKRNVFESLRKFDEKFFMYGEETDLCVRAKGAGHKVLYDPSIKLIHVGPQNSSKNKYIYNSMKVYLSKHHHGHSFVRRQHLFISYWGVRLLDKLRISS